MIMPVSAAQSYVKPSFKGAIKESVALNEMVKTFTKVEKTRWDSVKKIAENTNDNLFFQILSNVKQIGDTVIKSLQVFSNNQNLIAEEVYRVTRNGSVFMYDRQTVARKMLELFENLYKE